MGRAYEVRKASIQKTGAAKAKLYSTFAKEIYLAAKKGVPEIESNINLNFYMVLIYSAITLINSAFIALLFFFILEMPPVCTTLTTLCFSYFLLSGKTMNKVSN